jgi:hypothetical protein
MSLVIDFLVRMRRSFFVLVMTLTAGGCSALLGLEDRPSDNGFTDDDEAGRADRRVETLLDGEQSDGPGSSSGGPDAGSDVSLIPCFDGGKQQPAYFCDDFESGPTFKPGWTPFTTNGGEVSVKLFTNSEGGQETRPASGLRFMTSGFNDIPMTGNAYVRYMHPKGASIGGPLAVRFSWYLETDAWAATGRHPIASMTTANGVVVKLVFVVQQDQSDGQLEVDIPGAPRSLLIGPSNKETWVCYELVADGTNLEVWKNTRREDFLPFTQPIGSVDLGIKWVAPGPSTGNSNFNQYDDVIISPARVGCN